MNPRRVPATSTDASGRRVVVVGASSGIGAAIAGAAIAAGTEVVLSARRPDKLAEVVAEHGGGHVIAADATDPNEVRALLDAAAAHLGGIDLVVYVAGAGLVQPLAEIEPQRWLDIFDVNVIGANLVAGAALDHLEDDGIIAFISSRTVDDVNAHFAAYSATKAALDQCIATWRVEHPSRRFVRVVMGNAQPTEFADHMGDPKAVGVALSRWIEQGINVSTMMNTDDVGAALVAALTAALDHPDIDSSELRFDARTPHPAAPEGNQ